MDPDENFFSLLHSTAEALTDENLTSMRYLCKDVVSFHKHFDTAFIYLQHLQAQGWINVTDMTFLAEILYRINRHDLLKRLPGVKNRKDYEVNFLSSNESGQNFTAFRVACFLLTEELSSSEFLVLKNFCIGKLSTRNFQRSNDIYTLMVYLEEEDVMSEGNLEFFLSSLRHLDNQTPFINFDCLSQGDHSFLYPRKQEYQPPQRSFGYRPYQSLPNFTSHTFVPPTAQYEYQQPLVYHASFNNMERSYRTNSYESQRFSLPSATSGTTPSQISTDGTYHRVPNPKYTHSIVSDSKTFSEQQEHPSKNGESFQDPQNHKHFWTDAHTESNPKQLVQMESYPKHVTITENSSEDVYTDETHENETQLKHPFSSSSYTETYWSDIGNPPCMPSYTSGTSHAVDSEILHSVHPSHVSNEDYHENSHPHTCPTPDYSETVENNRCDIDPPSLCKDFKARGTIDHYPMDSNPVGKCVIVNNASFQGSVNMPEAQRRLNLRGHNYPVPNIGLKNRIGSEQDVKKISGLFKSFGFQTSVYEDLDSRKMEYLLESVAREDHSRHDCFVLIIMSHGALGSIYGVDGMPVRCAEIKSMFKPGKCPSLLNKPKIFFFQACQGEQSMDGHAAPVADVDDIETDGHVEHATTSTPSEADFLICYSTVPGYISYRSRKTGSFFINLVADNLLKLHRSEDVLSIMTNVNAELAKHSLNQTGMPVSTLRKKVFFKLHKK